MRTDTEFAREALNRAGIIKKKNEANRRKLTALCSAAVSLAVIVAVSFFLPSIDAETMAAGGLYGASLFAEGAAGGYVLIGVVGFALGVAVALYCLRNDKRG